MELDPTQALPIEDRRQDSAPSAVPVVENLVALGKRLVLHPLARTARRTAARLDVIAGGLDGETDHSRRGIGRQIGLVRLELEHLSHAIDDASLLFHHTAKFCSPLPAEPWLSRCRFLIKRAEQCWTDAQCALEESLQARATYFETQCPDHFPAVGTKDAQDICESAAAALKEPAANLRALADELHAFVGVEPTDGAEADEPDDLERNKQPK